MQLGHITWVWCPSQSQHCFIIPLNMHIGYVISDVTWVHLVFWVFQKLMPCPGATQPGVIRPWLAEETLVSVKSVHRSSSFAYCSSLLVTQNAMISFRMMSLPRFSVTGTVAGSGCFLWLKQILSGPITFHTTRDLDIACLKFIQAQVISSSKP